MPPALELSVDELRELKQAVHDHLHSLRVELASADHREFKEKLRARIERLEVVGGRLEKAVPDAGAR